jgi:hypothetical protein
MKSKTLDRLKKLEGAGFSLVVLRAAALRNFETGESPGNPKLARLIQDLRLTVLAMEMSVPGPEGADPTAEALGFTPTPGDLTQARQALGQRGAV